MQRHTRQKKCLNYLKAIDFVQKQDLCLHYPTVQHEKNVNVYMAVSVHCCEEAPDQEMKTEVFGADFVASLRRLFLTVAIHCCICPVTVLYRSKYGLF